ncbi:hypothetical protein [Peribacillus kribbensis]|nr:hypothetical protein [Peribacillus kribbensis]
MTRFLTPEEMYRKKVVRKRLTYVFTFTAVLGIIALVQILMYRM